MHLNPFSYLIPHLVHYMPGPFAEAFMLRGLIAVVLIGVTCATLGVYVVLRQMAFIGDAMAHTALPGLALAKIYAWPLFLGALVADLLTALGIASFSRRHNVREDTAIGILFTAMLALGIIIMSRARLFTDLQDMLIGNLVSVTDADLCLMAGACALVLATLAILHKELELTSCDPAYAQVIGLSAPLLRMVLLILLALTVVACIGVVGVVLTSGLLITPAATAALVTHRLRTMMLWSVFIAVAAGVGGLFASRYFAFSSGASIVMLCAFAFVLVYLVKSLRTRPRLA